MENFSSYFKTLVLTALFAVLGISQAFAQPANDLCANAIPLTVNAGCVNGTTTSATATGESICAGTFTQGVWYKFVATSTTHIVSITNLLGGGCHMGSAVYTGSCPGTRITCIAAAEGLLNQRHNLSGLIIGQTYLVQIIYAPGGPCGTGQTFCIGVNTGKDDPTGCLCADLSSSTSGNCHSSSFGGGSECIQALGGTCPEIALSQDAIFMVRPTTSPMVITVGNLGTALTGGKIQLMIYSGNNCGALVAVPGSSGALPVCSATSATVLTYSQTVTVGTKYWVFVSYSTLNDGEPNTNTEFGICIGNGSACSINGCGAAPPTPPGGAYSISATGAGAGGTVATGNVVQCELYAAAGTGTPRPGTGGFIIANNGVATTFVNTLTSVTYPITTFTAGTVTTASISRYPIITAENINCFNTNIDFTTVDPTPLWTATAFGTAATSLTVSSSTAATIPDVRYTGTLGRRTILFQGNIVSGSNDQNVTYPDFVNMVMGLPTSGGILGATDVCPNIGNTYGSTLAGTPGLTYLWTASTPSSNVATFADPIASYTDIYFANNTIATLTYVVSLTVTSECCGVLSPIVTYTVDVLPDPTAPTVVSTYITNCVGGVTTMTANAVAGSTYQWYDDPLAGNLLGNSASYILTYTPTGITSYYVAAVNSQGCPSVRTTVVVNGTFLSPAVAGVNICAPGILVLPVTNAAALPGATYTWYDGACGGPILQQSTSVSYSPNITATQTFYVSATEPGCAESACTPVTVGLSGSPTLLTWTGAGATGPNNWFNKFNWTGVLGTQPATTFTNISGGAIPNDGCATSTGMVSSITVSGLSTAVASSGITATINIFHNDVSQVLVFLKAPNGQILELTNKNAAKSGSVPAGINYVGTTFSDAGATNISAITGPQNPYTNTYIPEGGTAAVCGITPTTGITNFAGFGGGSIVPNGVWQLIIFDDNNKTSGGSLDSWSIAFPSAILNGNCVPTCATDVIIPNTAGLPITNPPDIGFSGSATIFAQAGNLTLANGNQLSFSTANSRLNICGNFTHAGTLRTNNLGRVAFMGTVPQTYTNTTTVTTVTTRTDNTFNNVTIENTASVPTVTVNGNMTVGNMVGHTTGVMLFNAGRLVLPAGNTLTMANRATNALFSYDIDEYIVTETSTSQLRRYLLTAGGSYDFPVGNINRDSYQLQNLNFASGHGIDFIDVNFTNPANATGTGLPMVEASTIYTYTSILANGGVNPVTDNANGGVWTVTPNVPGTATYTCTLYGTNFLLDAAATRYTVLKRVTTGPGAWIFDGTYVSSTLASPITAVRSGMAGFSQFAIGKSISVIPLPVKLVNLTATCNDDVITVKWSTSSEKSASTFTLEKSDNGREFTEVKVVKAAGTTNVEQYYSAIDSKPFEGTTYYRLKIIDKNGMIDYTKVIEAVSPCSKGNESFYIFPNPAKTEAKVVFTAAGEGVAIVKVKNAVGQEVILNKVETVAGENSYQLNLNGFATGVYMVSVTMNEETQTGKLVVNNR